MPVTLPVFLRRPQISGIVRSADIPSNYLYQRWFPMDPVESDEFESLVVLDEVNLAPFVNVDAVTPRMPDDIIGSYKWEVAYIRYKKSFKESDFRVFFEPGVSDPNTLTAANARAQESKMRRYMDALSQSIEARKEWMFASAIGGSISYNDTHVQYSVTYDGAYIGSTNRKVPSTLWSAASPTILNNLATWIAELSDETGVDEFVLLAAPKGLELMAKDSGVQRAWQNSQRIPAANDPGSLNPTRATMVAGALSLVGITEVIRYTAKYTTRTEAAGSVTRTKNRFINENDIFLLPANMPLGRIATAPAMPNNYQPGKFGWTKEEQDPWTVDVGAGEYAWIDFPPTRHNYVLQARVA